MANVKIRQCPLFKETASRFLIDGSATLKSFENFIKTKVENPIAPYGSSDKSNPAGTPMATEVPKIRHAHLTRDLSIFYTISGANPSELKLYAILTHDEAGTGQPVNYKKQKGIARKMANQDFI